MLRNSTQSYRAFIVSSLKKASITLPRTSLLFSCPHLALSPTIFPSKRATPCPGWGGASESSLRRPNEANFGRRGIRPSPRGETGVRRWSKRTAEKRRVCSKKLFGSLWDDAPGDWKRPKFHVKTYDADAGLTLVGSWFRWERRSMEFNPGPKVTRSAVLH